MSSSVVQRDARRCIFLSGNRADFDYLAPILRGCAATVGVEAILAVTGAHLSPAHGMTVDQLVHDGFEIHFRIPSLHGPSTPANRARTLARGLLGFLDVVEQQQPDAVFALGDREEVLIAGIAAAYCRVPFIHYGAGDEAFDGNVDNQVRHAASKLASLHLVFHPAHKKMLEAQGEDPRFIHNVGLTSIDSLIESPDIGDAALERLMGGALPKQPWALVVFHPIITSHEMAGAQMQLLLETVHATGLAAIVGMPNPDAGADAVRSTIASLAPQLGFLTYQNLPRAAFASLVRRASLLVGNSSMGVLEAPAIGLPAVNVGARQGDRLRGANVILADLDAGSITSALNIARSGEFRRAAKDSPSPYGGGGSGALIAQLIATTPLSPTKKFDNLRWAFAAGATP